MRIEGAQGAVDPTAATSPTNGATRDEFLRLFVAQLEHQDPLDPTSGADFVAQLAQFATLEQTAEVNSRLGRIEMEQASTSRTAILSLVGRTVETKADSIYLSHEGEPPQLMVELDAPASTVEVVIRDADGDIVRTMALGPHTAGEIDASWDGKDDSGVKLPEGDYQIEVRAEAESGQVSARAFVSGEVTGVEFTDGLVRVRVGSFFLSPGDIESVGT